MDDTYVLDVGKMRFHVRDRNVKRLRDVTDPGCPYEETCFYSVPIGMPNVEENCYGTAATQEQSSAV
jgi:hypothetical protein